MHSIHRRTTLKVIFLLLLSFAIIPSGALYAKDLVEPDSLDSTDSGGSPPSAPTLYTPSTTQTSASLSWSSVSGATGYIVYMNGSYVTTTSSTSYTKTGLSCGTSYSFYVKAQNSYGASPASNTKSTSTDPCTPSAPNSVNLTTVSDSGLMLSWNDTSSNESGFKIYEYSDTITKEDSLIPRAHAATWTYVATVSANAESYYITGLSCSSSYTYGVRSYNDGGSSSIVSGGEATTYPCTTAPSNLSSQLVSETQISFSWSDTAEEIRYGLYKSDGTALDTNISANTTSYSLNWPICGTTTFYLKAAYQHGTVVWSGSSNTTSKTITAPSVCDTNPPTPNPPTVSASPLSQTSISVELSTGSDDFGLHSTPYGVSVNAVNGGAYSWSSSRNSSVGSLSCGTTYTFYGKIRDAVGNQTSAGSDSTTTQPCTPNAPSNLSATNVTRESLRLTWNDNSNDEDGFRINETRFGSSYDNDVSQNTTLYDVSNLSCGTIYTFEIRSFVNFGATRIYSSPSNQINVSTSACDTSPPSISTNPSSRSWSTSNISVTASASDASGVSYTRHCWTTSTSCDPGTTSSSTFTNGGTISQTSEGSRYLCIRARDTVGNWNPSPVCFGSYQKDTSPPTPNPPTISTSSVGQTSVLLTLSAASDSYSGLNTNPYGFSINNSTYQWGGVRTESWAGLSCGTTYTFYGKVRDALGNTTSVASTSVTTLPCTPSGLSASAVSQTQINLSWSAPSGIVDGYYVYRNGSYITTRTGKTSTSYSNTGLSCGTSYSYKVRAYNSSGSSGDSNTVSETTYTCDTTGPTISFSPTSRSWSTSNASVTVTASDASGVSSTQYCWTTGTSCTPSTGFSNGGSITQSSSGNWKLFITATDVYNNSTSTSSQYYQVDKTAPTPNPPSVSTSSITQETVSATISTGSDSHAGLNSLPYGFSTNGSTFTWYSSPTQTIANLNCGTGYTIYGRIRDALGNQTSSGTSGITTSNCINAPTVLENALNFQVRSGSYEYTATWQNASADGYVIYRIDNATGGLTPMTDTNSLSHSGVFQPKCPAEYTIGFYGYNADPTVSGVDSTCSSISSNLPSQYRTGRKCSTLRTTDVDVKHCTQGFLID